jgi:hypothetical protein
MSGATILLHGNVSDQSLVGIEEAVHRTANLQVLAANVERLLACAASTQATANVVEWHLRAVWRNRGDADPRLSPTFD